MKILIFNWRDTNHPKAGGAEIVTLEHAKGWVQRGHSVTWFTAAFSGARRNEIIDGVSIVRAAGSLTVYLVAPFYYLRNRNSFDVVIDEIHGVPFFTPLFVRGPKVAFIHEVAGEIWDYMVPFPISYIGKTLERLYFRLYRNIPFWTDAPSTIPHLEALGIPKSHCTAIPCPITNEPTDKPVKKEKTPTFIFVSRVVKMKGIEEVIKAFSFIIKEEPEAKLWIVGGGDVSYMGKLKGMLREYGIEKSVLFLGKISQREKLERMGRAHILLHASVREGWGLVVLEAASQWTPSVVYNVSGLCDVVKDGKTGIVLRENSPREMAREALLLLRDMLRYREFQKAGVNWVKSLSWKNVIDESTTLLSKEIANPS